jgi:hypothetical protein
VVYEPDGEHSIAHRVLEEMYSNRDGVRVLRTRANGKQYALKCFSKNRLALTDASVASGYENALVMSQENVAHEMQINRYLRTSLKTRSTQSLFAIAREWFQLPESLCIATV